MCLMPLRFKSWMNRRKEAKSPKNVCKQPYNVYAESMMSLGRGLPLMKTSPPIMIHADDTRTVVDHTWVAQVGYYHRGEFKVLFDAGQPIGTRLPGVEVPHGFVLNPYIASEQRNAVMDLSIPAGDVAQGLERKNLMAASIVSPGSPITPVTMDASFSLKTTRQEGAFLRTHQETQVYDVHREEPFKEYMLRHYKSWVQFGRDNGHSVDYENLIFVTGVDLTDSYDMLIYAKSAEQKSASFSINAGSFGGVSLSRDVSESRPFRVWPRLQPGIERGSDSRPRQCTFVRGWRLQSRFGIVDKLRGGGGPHDLGSSPAPDDTSSIRSPVGCDTVDDPVMDAVRIPEGRQNDNPLQPMFDYIFENSDAKLAMVHDSHYAALLTDEIRRRATTIKEVLKMARPRIQVDQDGVGTLSLSFISDTESSTTTVARPSMKAELAIQESPSPSTTCFSFCRPATLGMFNRSQPVTSLPKQAHDVYAKPFSRPGHGLAVWVPDPPLPPHDEPPLKNGLINYVRTTPRP